MKQLFSKFSNVWFLWSVALAINIIAFLFVFYKIIPSNKTLALHYNVLVGVDVYGKGINLYNLPAIAFALSIINFILFRALEKNKNFLAFLALIATFCVQIVMFIALVFLDRIN